MTTHLLDQTALDRLRSFGGDKLLRGMIDLFVKNAPPRVASARAALDAGDAPGVKTALHALKSSSGQLGAASVHQACAEGEELASRGELGDCAPHVALIERELPLACAELQAIRPAES